ncbi:hypothetical protein KC359_g198 [Hortaea werneckii]|nr:hypothetical protein KC359_g198 [Hortaea werneckii]
MRFLISSKLEKKIMLSRQLLTTETARPKLEERDRWSSRMPATGAKELVFITGKDTYTGPTYDTAEAACEHHGIGW